MPKDLRSNRVCTGSLASFMISPFVDAGVRENKSQSCQLVPHRGPVSRRSLVHPIFLPRFVIADKPKYNSEGQSGAGQGCDQTRGGLIKIENDESANRCEYCDQHYSSYLDDSAA